jgi:putative transcriptional regulator
MDSVEQSSHPSEKLLAQYAAGALPAAPAMVISAHLEHCETCQPAVAPREEPMHGEILESLADTAMAPDALQLALARIETPAERAPSLAWRCSSA